MKQKEEISPATEQVAPPEPEEVKPPQPVKLPEPDFLGQYRLCYPRVKKFHVTGDGLVFLDRDFKQALSHQNRIGKGELTTY